MGNLIKCKHQLIKAEFNNNKKKNRFNLIKAFLLYLFKAVDFYINSPV